MPDGLKEASLEMMVGVKECAFALGKCVNQLAEKPEEALKAAAIEYRWLFHQDYSCTFYEIPIDKKLRGRSDRPVWFC